MDTYNHWGSLALGDGVSKVPEPNNQYPPEYCVAANYSMVDSDKIWSWADTNCAAGMFPYICKITRGCRSGGWLLYCALLVLGWLGTQRCSSGHRRGGLPVGISWSF
jgi:hypothetical protein